jgi:hypothetical protein
VRGDVAPRGQQRGGRERGEGRGGEGREGKGRGGRCVCTDAHVRADAGLRPCGLFFYRVGGW